MTRETQTIKLRVTKQTPYLTQALHFGHQFQLFFFCGSLTVAFATYICSLLAYFLACTSRIITILLAHLLGIFILGDP